MTHMFPAQMQWIGAYLNSIYTTIAIQVRSSLTPQEFDLKDKLDATPYYILMTLEDHQHSLCSLHTSI